MNPLWIVQNGTVVNLERVDRMQVLPGMVKFWTGEKMDAINSLSPFRILDTPHLVEQVIRPALRHEEDNDGLPADPD